MTSAPVLPPPAPVAATAGARQPARWAVGVGLGAAARRRGVLLSVVWRVGAGPFLAGLRLIDAGAGRAVAASAWSRRRRRPGGGAWSPAGWACGCRCVPRWRTATGRSSSTRRCPAGCSATCTGRCATAARPATSAAASGPWCGSAPRGRSCSRCWRWSSWWRSRRRSGRRCRSSPGSCSRCWPCWPAGPRRAAHRGVPVGPGRPHRAVRRRGPGCWPGGPGRGWCSPRPCRGRRSPGHVPGRGAHAAGVTPRCPCWCR